MYGDKAPCYGSMENCFQLFNRGRRLLKDEIPEGPPKTGVEPENIDAVPELIMQDRHVTYREIERFLGISPTNVFDIA